MLPPNYDSNISDLQVPKNMKSKNKIILMKNKEQTITKKSVMTKKKALIPTKALIFKLEEKEIKQICSIHFNK